MTKLLPNMNTNLTIQSIGWCLNDSAGSYPGDIFAISANKKPEKSDIFNKPFKNFGRLDDMSKAVCTAVAFALKGAKLYPQEEKQPISLFFSNQDGSSHSDTEYFKDFVNFGETSGRANLFLYTLPTSPLGEASVHFGLTGDIAYLSCLAVPSRRSGSADSENPLKAMLEAAEDSCAFRKSACETKQFLIGLGSFDGNKAETIFLFLSNNNSNTITESEIIINHLPDFKNLKEIIKEKNLKNEMP